MLAQFIFTISWWKIKFSNCNCGF